MTDPTFPHHHVRPAKGWLNDPNGVCFVDGRWHVFFQHNPRAPHHHKVGWGHWSSTDLVSWEQHPDALVPQPGSLDQGGCWSGSFVMDDQTPTLCYTAVADHARDGVGLVARGSADLLEWTPATSASAPRFGGPTDETRDPFPFVLDGRRYIAQGSGGPEGTAQVLVYDAEDLAHWRLLGPLLTIEDPIAREHAEATIWECPNVLQVEGHWVVLLSLWKWNGTQGVLSGVRWLLGDMVLEGECPRFVPRTGGVLDDGPAFYAPQGASDGERVLLWGWSWELDRDEAWLEAHGWCGTLTTPRVLDVHEGRLVQEPAPEHLARYRLPLPPSWPVADAASFLVSAERETTLVCSAVDGGENSITLPAGSRLLVDGSLVELFHEGRSLTTRLYPLPEAHWSLRGEGSTALAIG